MRIDMHCHTREGSLDGKVPLKDYVLRLKALGYDGMLITDHNSYKAYRYYVRHANDYEFEDFTVLKGIEYDTCDAGHILVIMPEGFLPILEVRGIPVRMLIEIVHTFHGILGPAHPCGEKFLSITICKYYQKHPEVISMFDFIEVFNSNVTDEANEKAVALAEEYGLPGTSGSDSHKLDNIGLAYTEFTRPITTESDLIEYIKAGEQPVTCGGSHYTGAKHDHYGWFYDVILLRLWNLSNRIINRRRETQRLDEWDRLMSESNTLAQRMQALWVKGVFKDIVTGREEKRLDRLMTRHNRIENRITKLEADVAEAEEQNTVPEKEEELLEAAESSEGKASA